MKTLLNLLKKSKIGIVTALLFAFLGELYASNIPAIKTDSTKIHFYEMEFRMGKISPTSPRFAPCGPLYSVLFSFGELQYHPDLRWAKFHNYPLTGVTVGFTNFGAPDIYGYEIKAIPFVEYIVGKKMRFRPTIKAGLGISYTTQNYRTNPANIALGAPINWAFELNFRFNLITTPFGIFRIGVGYAHSSDGHTQLPNMGINALVGNISFLHIDKSTYFEPKKSFEKPKVEKKITYFAQVNPFMGFHELGGPLGPVGGPKRHVYGTNFMLGLVLNQGFKFYIGVGYRYYEHFNHVYHHDQHPDIDKYSSAFAFASNYYIINGLELMYGHFGFTFEGGFNLYKPFYKTYCDLYSPENPTKFILKKYLNSRVGIKVYLFSVSKEPSFNLFIGGHVNANLGQADFTELSIGYLHKLGR